MTNQDTQGNSKNFKNEFKKNEVNEEEKKKKATKTKKRKGDGEQETREV